MNRLEPADRMNAAWNRLTPCIPMLRSYARRVTESEDLASEVFQETCLRILRHRGVPSDSNRYEAWCRGVARNVWVAQRRRIFPKGSEVAFDDELHEASDPRVDPEHRLYQNERFARASRRIDDDSVELLVRRYVLGERIVDLAEERAQRPATLRMRLLRLRSVLRRSKRR